MDKDDFRHIRGAWRYRGQSRPAGAVMPGPGQESVWDYPRPPVIVADTRCIEVRLDGVLIADTRAALRVLETANPPTFYLPSAALCCDCLRPERERTFCEWKGQARYYSLCIGERSVNHAAWSYPAPYAGFLAIRNYLAFYPDRMECYVDGERARAQAGGFYGGWTTDEIVGPFKGEPGTSGW
jgi:uncharacterized protein (DUF427 family)